MKLTSAQVDQVLDQFDGEVIPPDNPSVPELEATFGPHTFFVATEGLHLVERSDGSNSRKHPAYVVRVAGWWDDEKTSLLPLDPEVVVAVDLGAEGGPDLAP
jgi:hypothetical protein